MDVVQFLKLIGRKGEELARLAAIARGEYSGLHALNYEGPKVSTSYDHSIIEGTAEQREKAVKDLPKVREEYRRLYSIAYKLEFLFYMQMKKPKAPSPFLDSMAYYVEGVPLEDIAYRRGLNITSIKNRIKTSCRTMNSIISPVQYEGLAAGILTIDYERKILPVHSVGISASNHNRR